MELNYRADIDGLRAIAVLAVLFFHTEVPGFTGGFVGVDVFFVISGYLITSIILKEIKAEKFSIARFYERRIRRIFPALFPVIAFVLAAGAYLFDANAFKDLGQSIAATTLFSSNILFWRESGYFAAPSLQKPLLHTWSLAVEEQFYIIFPLALAFIHRYLKGQYLLWVMAAFIISLVASIYGVAHHPGATFYLVPTRAWELMVGSMLALGALPDLSKDWQRNVLTLSGLAFILFSIFFYTEATPFPGASALIPVMGSGFIIYSGMGGGTRIAQRLLTARPLAFIGLISYSLYLWHWPLVVFAKYLMFRPFNGLDSAAIILASLLLATFSWKFIEQPFRGKQMLLPERKRLFAVAGVVMVVAVGLGGVVHLRNGMPGRIDRFYPEITDVIDRAKNDPIWDLHGKWEEKTKEIGESITLPVVGKDGIMPTFALVGDSHARALIPALERQAMQSGTAGYIITVSSTPFFQGVSIISSNDNGFNESAHNEDVLTFIQNRQEIQTIILIARWGSYIQGHWTTKSEDSMSIILADARGQYSKKRSNALIMNVGLTRTINALLAMNRKVILVSDVPEIGYDVPRVYMMQTIFPFFTKRTEFRPSIAEYNERQKEANAILEELDNLPNVTLVRPEKLMFDENGRGRIMANGKLLYRDDDHLSTDGALYVAPVFDEVFREMANDQSEGRKISAN
ncbi:MAG: acyltransferase [Chlorobiaceae bacterium]|nr:acyltransferase [Chlorobiaceae bacterium]